MSAQPVHSFPVGAGLYLEDCLGDMESKVVHSDIQRYPGLPTLVPFPVTLYLLNETLFVFEASA